MTLPDGTRTNMRSIPGMASLLEPRPAPAGAAPASSSNPSESCTQTIERDGNTYLLAGKCAGEHTTLARAVISGDFQKSLTAQITIKRDDGEPLGPGLPNQIAARQDQRWVSVCPADMRPGDIVMSDGTKTNFRALRAAK
jgi:hypothetical protein